MLLEMFVGLLQLLSETPHSVFREEIVTAATRIRIGCQNSTLLHYVFITPIKTSQNSYSMKSGTLHCFLSSVKVLAHSTNSKYLLKH
jgi:hypothetical protein